MIAGAPLARTLRAATGGRPIPTTVKLGAVLIAAGLLFDLVEHTLVSHAHEAELAGFPIQEHLAHLVVLVGMVVVLLGVIVDGVRTGRAGRPEGSSRDAVR